MNKKTTIAFKFFNSIENNSEYNFEVISNFFLEQGPKNKNGDKFDYSNYRRIRNEIIRYFNYLYGLKETFPMFVEWIIKYKKIHIPNNTIFTYRDLEWMRQEGLTWTEILLREGVKQPIIWVYKDNQLVEINYSINLDSNDGI